MKDPDRVVIRQSVTFSVDVVIPVYNSPVLTKRCIDSVLTHLKESIQQICIQDDASHVETRTLLDEWVDAKIHVHHAEKNQGYGRSVNDAVARCEADLVLVLNSDTEIRENFLPTLCQALQEDDKLAIISPIHDAFFRHEASRYQRQTGGYITTYRFQGYGFLVRRKLFLALGGFDQQFGRGYYEDTDLGRRLIAQGWRLGVHPDCYLHHEGGASFGRGKEYRALVARNRALYFSRYPDAQRNILMISARHTLDNLSSELKDNLDKVMQQGGSVYWVTSSPLTQLSCLQMHTVALKLTEVIRLILKGRSRLDKRISAFWILPGISLIWRILLIGWARLNHLEVKNWPC